MRICARTNYIGYYAIGITYKVAPVSQDNDGKVVFTLKS